MALRDYSDVYVAACGEPFPSRWEGLRHERSCPYCQAALRGELEESEGDRDDESPDVDERDN